MDQSLSVVKPSYGGINRTAYTWLAYGMLGFYAYMQSSLSPIMPFLRDEISMSYTIAGLHLSAFALGMSFTGLSGSHVVRWLGRWRAFWLGGAGMCLGGVLLIVAQSPVFTILASLCMGLLGSFLVVIIQSTLADQFGPRRAVALTEANMAAMILASVVPLAISLGNRWLDSWRPAIWIGVVGFGLAFVMLRGLEMPQKQPRSLESSDQPTTDETLPPKLWVYWIILFLGVAVEWSVIFWTPELLIARLDYTEEHAALMMSVFFMAAIVGRFLGSHLTHRYRALHLLLASEGVLLVGIPLLWLATDSPINTIGLILVGIGAGNLFPMALSAVSNAGAAQSDSTSSKVTGSAGLAILTIPLLLGNIADHAGIIRAFGIVPIFLLLVIAASVFALRIRIAD